MQRRLRLGTRGSALALWQANMVADRLRGGIPGLEVELVLLKTTGDVRQDVPLATVAGRGVFVREIEAALLRGDVDLAVHSAKDLPSSDPAGLVLAAFCERADPRDAFISSHGGLNALPPGAVVATGSPRRVAQLKHRRPDLQFTDIRGNVDTRLAKLERGEADALVLAVAGVSRLGREEVITEKLSIEVCLPQVGQACVAVQCRADDAETIERIAQACDHEPTRRAVTAERAFLALLGGGCTAPVAAYARVEAGKALTLTGLVSTLDGATVLRSEHRENAEQGSASLAQTVFDDLLLQGAGRLLEEQTAQEAVELSG